MPDIKTELHIPDLWFDFYARFLPGVVFVMASRLVVFGDSSLPSAWEIPCFAFAGYICALITQPLASMITGKVESCFARKFGDEDYIQALQWYLSTELKEKQRQAGNRQAMILSKMHGETTFFAQLFVLGAVVFVLQFISPFSLCIWGLIINYLCEIIFLGAACEVTYRRLKRAKKRGDITGFDRWRKKQQDDA